MSSENHLHPAAMLIGAIKTVRRWISGLAIPGVVLLMSQGFSLRTVTLFLLGLLIVAALAALWGFLSWRATGIDRSTVRALSTGRPDWPEHSGQDGEGARAGRLHPEGGAEQEPLGRRDEPLDCRRGG